MSLNLKIVHKDGTVEDKPYHLCLAYFRNASKKGLNTIKYFRISSTKKIDNFDKRYHSLLMNSFIKNYLAPDKPLVVKFYPTDSWGLIFLVTSSIRISWEQEGLMRNILEWYEKGKCSADEAIVLGNIALYGEKPQYQLVRAGNHGYIDEKTPINGLISRSRNLLSIVENEIGINERIIDFKKRINKDYFRCNSRVISSLRKKDGYHLSNDLNMGLEEIKKLINIPTNIEREKSVKVCDN